MQQLDRELYSVSAQPIVLSDNSVAWNVEQSYDGGKIVFACEDKAHAHKLAELLRDCSWLDIVPDTNS